MAQVQLKARNTIILSVTPGKAGDKAKGIAPTPPVTKEVAPGKLFKVDEAMAKQLTTGTKPAAEVYTPGDETVVDGTEKPAAKKPGRKPGPKPKEPDPDATTGEGDADKTGKSDRI